MATVAESLKLSLQAAAMATPVAALLGALLGWAVARWRPELRIILNILWVVPAPLLIYCIASESPRLSWMTLLGVLSALPLLAKSVVDAFGADMPAPEKAVRSLGAPEWRVFTRVVVPTAHRALALVAGLAFARVMAESLAGLAVRP